MDNSLSLARYFARLVWLLAHDERSVAEQKGALRAVVAVSKGSPARLRGESGALAVNGVMLPQALTGVQELAGRLDAHAIEEIDIGQGAAPAELLELARLLASAAATSPDSVAFTQKLSTLRGATVKVKRRAAAAAAHAPVPPGAAPAAARGEPAPRGIADRVRRLLETLTSTSNPAAAQQTLDEVAYLTEQATREGRTADVVTTFSAMLQRGVALTDPEVRRVFLLTVRRLTLPTILRPIAVTFATEPAMAAKTEEILQRVGQDGVDAVVDCYAGSRTAPEREAYRGLLSRLAAARESLVQMLTDPRWHVVRVAAELLGEMGVADAERPLAELLRHRDARVRRSATRALSRIESAFTLDALARAVADSAPAVRLEAIAGLSARKSGRAGSVLAGAIDAEGDVEVQFAIVGALGRVGTAEAVQKLAKEAEAATGLFAARKSSGLRVAAVLALGDARTPAALAALQSLVNERDKDVREAVAKTLLLVRGTAA